MQSVVFVFLTGRAMMILNPTEKIICLFLASLWEGRIPAPLLSGASLFSLHKVLLPHFFLSLLVGATYSRGLLHRLLSLTVLHHSS